MAGVITGSLGKFCGVNRMREATIAAVGTWSASQPLANLLTNATSDNPRYIGAPARQPTPATLANSKIELSFTKPRSIGLVGVIFHTMSQPALMRITIAQPGATLATPTLQTEWLRVHPRINNSIRMPWNEPTWWSGQAPLADIDLYPRHRFVPFNQTLVEQIRIEFDDRTNATGYFDIGGLILAQGWSPEFNFDRGRRVGMKFRDLIEEGASGRRFGQRRRARREITVTWSGLKEAEAWRLYDDCLRAGQVGHVLFVPDAGNLLGVAREAWPATIETPFEPVLTHEGLHSLTAVLSEVIA
jgi:hypothetical protein